MGKLTSTLEFYI
jgi:phosphatidylinositol 4-kinase A